MRHVLCSLFNKKKKKKHVTLSFAKERKRFRERYVTLYFFFLEFFLFRTTPGRIVGAVWWFFTVILISSYVSNFTAYLIVQKMSTPVSTPEDLVAQTEIDYGALAHGATWDFLKVSRVRKK